MVRIALTAPVTFFALVFSPLSAQQELPYKNYAPVWSPNGQEIAFYSSRDGDWEIYKININGTQLTRLTDSPGYDGEPSWSSDGSKIVFASDRDGDAEIFIMDADGRNVAQLTHNDVEDDVPTWSPVEDRILYRSARADSRYLFLIAADGSRHERLSDFDSLGRAKWSSDGHEITFVSDRDGRQVITRISRDGGLIEFVETQHRWPGNPAYLPMGDGILYDAHYKDGEESGDGKWELWVVALDGSSTKRLTNNQVDDWGGSWSPDGKYLAYAGGGLGNSGYEIFVSTPTGARTQRLTWPNN